MQQSGETKDVEKLLWSDGWSQAAGNDNAKVDFQERKAGFPPH